jgi:polyphosphate kinase 2 (PPK2 family)
MLDEINLSQTLKKKAYKPIRKAQIERIFDLSELVYEQKRPVIIVFEGWDAAGKGTTIRQLTAPLDARGFKVLATQAPRTHEKRKPWLWRFWMNLPRYGQIAIYDRSWYGRVLVERVAGLTPMPQWIAAYEEINNFERTLADDGAVFIKFWLHISKDEQLRRFMQLATEPENAWRVTAEDWENHRKYDEYLAAVRDMLAKTSTPIAPWTVVPATDSEVRLFLVFDTIIKRLETALALPPTPWPPLAELSNGDEDDDKPRDKPKKKDKAGKKKKAAKLAAETPLAAADDAPKKAKKAKHKAKDAAEDSASDGAASEAAQPVASPEAAPEPLPAKPATKKRKAAQPTVISTDEAAEPILEAPNA